MGKKKGRLPDRVVLKGTWKSSNCYLVLSLDERELEQPCDFCASGIQADIRYPARLRRYQIEYIRLVIGRGDLRARHGCGNCHWCALKDVPSARYIYLDSPCVTPCSGHGPEPSVASKRYLPERIRA